MPIDAQFNGRFLGSISIKENRIIFDCKNAQDQTLLQSILSAAWIGDKGIPMIKIDSHEYVKSSNGKFVIEGYANLKTHSPGGVLSAFFEFENALGVILVTFE